jgi:hypothetical protein
MTANFPPFPPDSYSDGRPELDVVHMPGPPNWAIGDGVDFQHWIVNGQL